MVRQKYFIPRELRFSVAIIILWSLLVTTGYSYLVKELSERMEHGFLFFMLISLGYILIVVVLTIIFSHRLIGPFQRLKTEMKLIQSGDYCKRLNVRDNDDLYIKSFLMEVNKLLDELEKTDNCRKDLAKCVDSELLNILALIDKGEASKEEMKEAIMAFHNRTRNKLGEVQE